MLLRFVDGAATDVLHEDLLEARLGDLEARDPLAARERGARGSWPDRGRRGRGAPRNPRAGSSARRRAPVSATRRRGRRPSVASRTTRRPIARFTSRTAPLTTTRPRSTMAIDSHSSSTVSIWWVLKMSVLPRSRISQERLLEQPHVDRVEPGEGLVHDQHLRVVQDRRDELDLLLVALGELLDLARPGSPGSGTAPASRRSRRAPWRPGTPYSAAKKRSCSPTTIFG